MRNSFLWLYNQEKSEYSLNDFRSRNYKGLWQKIFINKYIDEVFKNGNEKAHENLSNYKDEHLPKYLYKFFPPTTYNLINLKERKWDATLLPKLW